MLSSSLNQAGSTTPYTPNTGQFYKPAPSLPQQNAPNFQSTSGQSVYKPPAQGNVSGMLPQSSPIHATPTTPVKSLTTADGVKTEYHAPPAETAPKAPAPSSTPAPTVPNNPPSGMQNGTAPKPPTDLSGQAPTQDQYKNIMAGSPTDQPFFTGSSSKPGANGGTLTQNFSQGGKNYQFTLDMSQIPPGTSMGDIMKQKAAEAVAAGQTSGDNIGLSQATLQNQANAQQAHPEAVQPYNASTGTYGGTSTTPGTSPGMVNNGTGGTSGNTNPGGTSGTQVAGTSAQTPPVPQIDPITGQPIPTGTNPGMIPSPYTNTSGLYGQAALDLANRSTQPGQAYSSAQDQANYWLQQQNALQQEFAQKDKNIQGTAGFLTQANGEEGLLQNQYNQVQGRLAQNYNAATGQIGAANTQQGLQQGALQGAAGLSAPATQFGQLTNPITGQVIGAGTSGNNPLLDNAVKNAVSIINSGGSYSDALSSISGFGQAGQQAFLNALGTSTGSGFNPTAANASANTGVAFGAQAKAQSLQLGLGLQNLDAISAPAINFFNKSLINPTDSSVWNGTIRQYTDKFGNTGAAAQANAYIADIKKYQSQIIASNNAGTPTGVENTFASIDPTYFSARELTDYLNTLKSLGQIQKGVLDENATKNLGSSTGNLGIQPSPTTPSVSAPNKPTTGANAVAIGKGAAASLLPNVAQGAAEGAGVAVGGSIVSKLWSGISKWLGFI